MVAVFGRTPSTAVSQACAWSSGRSARKSSDSSPRSCRTWRSAFWMRGPLMFDRPAERMAALTACGGAVLTLGQSGERAVHPAEERAGLRWRGGFGREGWVRSHSGGAVGRRRGGA